MRFILTRLKMFSKITLAYVLNRLAFGKGRAGNGKRNFRDERSEYEPKANENITDDEIPLNKYQLHNNQESLTQQKIKLLLTKSSTFGSPFARFQVFPTEYFRRRPF